ncbi:hypothetical protein T11_9025 [Trichinella zimbabwensis]|uniref:Uncharacterized protein n=1 Tax=Trichinella zimbabwensis TaxID=268475 RepID=A0A0V1HCF6_9BILA|nr:hypothetical protein T11_9025 [Trichinella zimbabwensis]
MPSLFPLNSYQDSAFTPISPQIRFYETSYQFRCNSLIFSDLFKSFLE